MLKRLFPDRFALLKMFIAIYLLLSFIIRLTFLIWNFSEVDTSFFKIGNTFIIGFLFDIGTISFFAIPYCIYLLLVPTIWHGSLVDRLITYFAYTLGLFIFIFSFFAEITFWEEFKNRFNFIAVDYLVYSNEVIKNINESYPIPLILITIVAILFIIIRFTKKRGVFDKTFKSNTSFKSKLVPSSVFISIALYCAFFVSNENAEQFKNRYNNELSKSGIYSFFAAFRNNELPYREFYQTIDDREAFLFVNKGLFNYEKVLALNYKLADTAFNKEADSLELAIDKNELELEKEGNSILRRISNSDSLNKPVHPNVMFICIESLSGKYLNTFGSDLNITPTIDSLAQNSLFFSNLYATGTRTVRGMEAITLSIPPTPGRSIVKRENNQDLFTIGEIFKEQGYERNFFYGGDGYFDNMNTFFGGNGFNIIDRGRGFLIDSDINTTRTNIEDDEVTFENAWGVCDGDIYTKVLKEADKMHEEGKPFFNFIMTTSNHRPYTYPENKIDIPSGTGRYGAIKYTDHAIKEFLNEAKTKPWYSNTVFVIMADHCAASAGKWDLDVKNYHIPALIFNTPNIKNQNVSKLCSQIDLFPTLFNLLKWDYNSNLFGKDILKMTKEDERAFIGNYRKLGLLKDDKLMILSEQKKASFYQWNEVDNSLNSLPIDDAFLKETTSYYQVADYLYRNKGLKLNE
jgi:phosphoglycerol transferase MdoB-like AlkP superfamily enzyme